MLYVLCIIIINTLIAVLKELIGYSDYSFEIMIFKSFETNQIFIFNTSHLCSKAFYCCFTTYIILDVFIGLSVISLIRVVLLEIFNHFGFGEYSLD